MVEQLDTLLDEPFAPREGQRYLPYTYYPPPCKVSKEFKRELAKIGGRTTDGRPILRCKWGMDILWLSAVRETSGEYVMRRVPRYCMSRDIAGREAQTAAGVWYIKQTGLFFGDPHFIIEEWKGPEHFRAPGVSLDEAERMWEEERYRVEETDQEQPPAQFKSEGELKEYRDAMARHRVLLTGDGKGGVVNERIDLMGPFPRSGRYQFLRRIRPAGAHPDNAALDRIRKQFWDRQHARDEIDELNLEMAAQRTRQRADSIGELEANLLSHWRSEAEKGEAARVFTPTKQFEEGANV